MKLYNTLTRSLDVFNPADPSNVKIYTCGPTVYDYAHIGNLTAYVYWDLLVRLLRSSHFQVNRVLNLTDVGHLTSDADDGEDKLEKGARREGKTVWEIAEHYADSFLKDYQALELIPPTKICKATDYIQQGIALVQRLTEQGYTYETTDGIYFDTAKFPRYAELARLDLDHLRAGARVEFSSEKHNPADFALWKFVREGEDHAMQWDYLGRPGYPGWHLECSTIIHEELGEPIDIHAGGIDHIPVHHTNEVAQSEAAFDQTLAHFWLHCNFITIEGEKISKSLGNIYTLADLAKQGFSPLDFKLWVLQGHYQSERNFSFTDLAAAKQRRLNWRNRLATLTQQDSPAPATPDFCDQLLKLVSDNLNSAEGFSFIDNSTLSYPDWEFVDQLFGLGLIDSIIPPSAHAEQLIKERSAARDAKDYSRADQLRAELEKEGITVLDTPSGPIWQYL